MSAIRIKTEVKKTVPWKLVIIFICFSAAVILLGITLYTSERNLIFKEQGNSLKAIASLKIRQIEQWHSERIADATVIKNDRPLIRDIKQFINSNDNDKRIEISIWMKSVLNGNDYSNVLLIDTLFNVRLTVSQSDIVPGDVIKKDLKEVLINHNIIMTDLHRSEDIPWIHLDILVPLIDSVRKKEIPVGIIILRVSPEKILFPLIQSWPVQSKSSETLLIRKEGDSVLFLNELRHRQNTALNLRISIKNGSLPASKAVNGVLGLVQGMDYRNIPVVAWLADVPDFSWKMVAKVDKEEILLPLKRYTILIFITVVLLILINASLFGFWIWQQQISSYKKQLQNEKSIRELEEIYRSLYENVSIGIYRTTLDGRILMANPAMVNMLGFDSFEQLTQRNLEQEGYEPGYPRSEFLEIIEKQGKVVGMESAWQQRNGKTLFVRENANAIRDAQGRILYYDGTVEDITDRKKTEEALYENEKRLKEAQEMAHLGFWRWDIKTGDVEWSEEVYKIFCLDPYIFTPKIDSILELSPWPEDHQRDKELIARAMETHTPGDYEQKFLRPDKSVGYYYSTFRGNYDDSGELISIVGTVLDITERKLAEDALRESEDKFKYVFDHSLIPKSITLPSGEINVNTAFCDMLGYQPEELKKINWADISHPDDIELTNNSLNLILSGKKDLARFTKRYIHKDGSVIWADVGTTLRRDADNNPQYFMTSVNDITERKAAEEALRDSEERFSKSFKTSPISFMIANMEDGKIIEVNDAFTTISGFTREEALASTTIDLKIWVNEQDRKHMIDSLREGNAVLHQETQLRAKDGKVQIVVLSAQIIKLGNRNCIISSIEDITERKNAESQIKKLNEELEDRVIQRTELLEAANNELEAFSYSVSHDLRAPLRSVHGYTKILIEEYEDKLDDEGKRICGIISSSATQMGELIDDLLNFSRIGRSSLNPLLLDMKSIVISVFADISSAKEKSRTKLKIGKLHKAFGDANLIKLVWNNLISNAIKYSSKENISEISVSSQLKYDRITYSVKDNGVGFDMNYKHKLFGVFQRLHGESEFEGNGVGLAIVQRIILKHGGTVWAEGEVGKGATFYFSLPVQDKRQK